MNQRLKKTIIQGIIVIMLIAIASGLSYLHLEYGIFYSPSVRQEHSELFEQESYIYLKKAFPANFPEAEKSARRAIRYNKDNIGAYIFLAWSLSGQGRLEDVTKVYRAGLELDPENFEMNFYLANAYREIGEFDLADQYYEKIIKLQPDNVMVWANWASGYSFNRNDWAGAVKIFEQALKLNPDNEKLKELYEMALENAKNAN